MKNRNETSSPSPYPSPRRGEGKGEGKILIVNADDFNLTLGVSRAILDCHESGIVSSTTVLINLDFPSAILKALKRIRTLGVGLHLNVTLGSSVSTSGKIKSLLQDGSRFKKQQDQTLHTPKPQELFTEWEAQVVQFRVKLGRLPTHLDTHHQLHGRPFFLKILIRLAKKYHLPIRRPHVSPSFPSPRCIMGPGPIIYPSRPSEIMGPGPIIGRSDSYCTTDFLYGDLDPMGYWRKQALLHCLKNLKSGISEVMCHPGKNDAALSRISSFTQGRGREYRLFRSPELRRQIKRFGIQLSHYGLCYTLKRR